MLISIIVIIFDLVFYYILNKSIYTDRAPMPDGNVRKWKRSPIDRLNISDSTWLLYLQLFFIVVSIISSILIMFGFKHQMIKIIQIVSFILSIIMFIIIMIFTSNTHVKYA